MAHAPHLKNVLRGGPILLLHKGHLSGPFARSRSAIVTVAGLMPMSESKSSSRGKVKTWAGVWRTGPRENAINSLLLPRAMREGLALLRFSFRIRRITQPMSVTFDPSMANGQILRILA